MEFIRKRCDCWGNSHFYPRLQQQTRTEPGIRTEHEMRTMILRWRNYEERLTSNRILSPRPKSAYGTNILNNGRSYDQRQNQTVTTNDRKRSRNGSLDSQRKNCQSNRKFSHSAFASRRDFSQNDSYSQRKADQPNSSVFQKTDNRTKNSFTLCEQKFPLNKSRTSSIVDPLLQPAKTSLNYPSLAC